MKSGKKYQPQFDELRSRKALPSCQDMTVWVLKDSNAKIAEAMFKYCFYWTAADVANPGLESALWGYDLPIKFAPWLILDSLAAPCARAKYGWKDAEKMLKRCERSKERSKRSKQNHVRYHHLTIILPWEFSPFINTSSPCLWFSEAKYVDTQCDYMTIIEWLYDCRY